ncbi:coatomer subunit beta'-2, putative [Entamoeba invadens IP1]|uniref:Coatomer subunit beta' n=1 Tax=Entamoeba invadens IP1 TaxID=370355 RepID=A0A0A1U5Y2_ENTIV|nr:coatomer subunit beta'-2, putative [Entamoeba invadens IP1]ELP89793.1 coatomer subunit beta'-2, putative [Entamoeba invadens IP1]|eukprot:XP_004256564.1 coatomer subunit beta'-2, putative [Entamoeba invadens IP1]
MPRFEIKRKVSTKSTRVKCVDFHPKEPWVLAALHTGSIYILNYQTKSIVKTVEVVDKPIRCARFMARKEQIVVGSDDRMIRVYNYNTMTLEKSFEAHSDYIRDIIVHPTLPYILTCSDDKTIKCFNFDQNFAEIMTFTGHVNAVMALAFNPKDPNIFASASLDGTVKVWGLNSNSPHFTLEGHEAGVCCVAYLQNDTRPYLLSAGEDTVIRVWDYQTKACVSQLEGHTDVIWSLKCHEDLPIIASASEDSTVRIWNIQTNKIERVLNYDFERNWTLSFFGNLLAIGADQGTLVIKIGSDEPTITMDGTGKIILTKRQDAVLMNCKGMEGADGEALSLPVKELGVVDVYPQTIKFSPNGRFVAIVGDADYIIYTTLAWRNVKYGNCSGFVWSDDGGYAVLDNGGNVKIFNNKFEEAEGQVLLEEAPEAIFGGNLLTVKYNGTLALYTWEGKFITEIQINAKNVKWSDTDLLSITSEGSYFILRYNEKVVRDFFMKNKKAPEDGLTEAFEVLSEIPETVKSGEWYGDAFIYINHNNSLCYYVGAFCSVITHLEGNMFLLGYLPKENKVVVSDVKGEAIVSYQLLNALLVFQSAVLRNDKEKIKEFLGLIPKEKLSVAATFLKQHNYPELALSISDDPEFKFDLAMSLNKIELAREMAEIINDDHQWKELTKLYLDEDEIDEAVECMFKGNDWSGILLFAVSLNDAELVERLMKITEEKEIWNICFVCAHILQIKEKCVDILQKTSRYPEAAMYAVTYGLPNELAKDIVQHWKDELKEIYPKQADALANPLDNPDLFVVNSEQ